MVIGKTPKADNLDRTSDETLTILIIAGLSIGGLIAGASFLKETLANCGPRRRKPWDV